MVRGKKKDDFNIDEIFIGQDRMALLEMGEVFKTNVIPMDMILGGGLCYGDIINIYSEKGLGKSTVYSQIIKNLIDDYGFTVYYIDVEAGTRNQIDKFGFKPYIEKGKLFITYKITTIGQLEKFFENTAEDDKFKKTIVLIDSITQLLSDSQIERSVDNQMVSAQAKDMTLVLTKARGGIISNKMILLLVSQMRSNLNAGAFGKKTKMAGCEALAHIPDVLLRIGKAKEGRIKVTSKGKEFVVGRHITLSTDEKNRKCGAVEVPCHFINGFGIENIMFLYNKLREENYIKQSGAFYKTDIIPNPDSEDGGWNLKGKSEVLKFIKNNFNEIYDILEKDEIFILNKIEGDVKYEF